MFAISKHCSCSLGKYPLVEVEEGRDGEREGEVCGLTYTLPQGCESG